VGQRLRLRRLQLNMTQHQLAKQLGLTFQQIQKYETAENRLSAGRLFRIAAIMIVPVSFFFEESGVETHFNGHADGREVMDLLSSAEGIALNRAYRGIRDPQVRKCLLDLLRILAPEALQ
jgi:transcriptional regulator with XRE-family HTH domain